MTTIRQLIERLAIMELMQGDNADKMVPMVSMRETVDKYGAAMLEAMVDPETGKETVTLATLYEHATVYDNAPNQTFAEALRDIAIEAGVRTQ